jgi:hypothetical protein
VAVTLPDNPPFGPLAASTLLATVTGPANARMVRVYRDTGSGFVRLINFGPDTTSITVAGKPGLIVPSTTGGGLTTRWDNFQAGTIAGNVAGNIESYFETALLYWEPGNIHFFTASRIRVTGSGTLLCTIKGEDEVLSATLPSTVLAATPGKEYLVRFNFQNEKAKLKFRLTSGKFVMSKFEVFGKPVYSMRPA